MKKILVSLIATVALFAGTTANATPLFCHGHNSACVAATTTAPTASITVNTDSTTVTGSGFLPAANVTVQVTYYDTFGDEALDVQGYDRSDANGNVAFTYSLGSEFITGYGSGYGYGYGYATLTLSDGTNTVQAST